MKRRVSPLLVFLLGGVLLAGCPAVPLDGPGTGQVSGTPGTGEGDPGSGPAADELSARFPGCTEPSDGVSWRAEVLQLINVERTSRGLSALTRNETLEAQAQQYACELIYYDFFDHVNPVTGSTADERAAEFGYDWSALGENLAAGQQTPALAVSDWMASAGHRANILGANYTELGVGVRAGGEYGVYWVVEFGRPR